MFYPAVPVRAASAYTVGFSGCVRTLRIEPTWRSLKPDTPRTANVIPSYFVWNCSTVIPGRR